VALCSSFERLLPLLTRAQVIALSAVKYHVTQEAWRGFYKPLWLGAALLNSAYSYFWDVERDWEISLFTQIGTQSVGAGCWLRGCPAAACGGVLFGLSTDSAGLEVHGSVE